MVKRGAWRDLPARPDFLSARPHFLRIQEAGRNCELGNILTPLLLRRTVGLPTSLLAGRHQAIPIDAPVGPRAVALPAMNVHRPRLVGSDCSYGGSEHCGGDYSLHLHI